MGGHGPFRGLDAPLALQKLYHDRKSNYVRLSLGSGRDWKLEPSELMNQNFVAHFQQQRNPLSLRDDLLNGASASPSSSGSRDAARMPPSPWHSHR
jgi:hypothetical protein